MPGLVSEGVDVDALGDWRDVDVDGEAADDDGVSDDPRRLGDIGVGASGRCCVRGGGVSPAGSPPTEAATAGATASSTAWTRSIRASAGSSARARVGVPANGGAVNGAGVGAPADGAGVFGAVADGGVTARGGRASAPPRSSPASSSVSSGGSETWPRERRRTIGGVLVVGAEGVARSGSRCGSGDREPDGDSVPESVAGSGALLGVRSGRPGELGGVAGDILGPSGGREGAPTPAAAGVVSWGSSGLGASIELARTRPGTTAGPPPRRRTTVVSPTPGKVDGGSSGAAGISATSAAVDARVAGEGVGAATRRRTASREGRLEVGRPLVDGFVEEAWARRERGRGAGGRALAGASSRRSSSTSSDVMRCSRSGPAAR